jgi:hypothetical protein
MHGVAKSYVAACDVGAGFHDRERPLAGWRLANGLLLGLVSAFDADLDWTIHGPAGAGDQQNGRDGQNRAFQHRNVPIPTETVPWLARA